MSTTLQLHVRPFLPWWMCQSSRSCRFFRCRSWRRQLRSRSCRLSRKSSRFQKSKLFNAPKLPRVLDIITPAPMEFVEAALHEIDEKLCRDDLEEICYVARMSRKRIWRCVWHGRSTPSDASKSERSWRRLAKCLCYEEEFDEMKRTCAYCGMFEVEE